MFYKDSVDFNNYKNEYTITYRCSNWVNSYDNMYMGNWNTNNYKDYTVPRYCGNVCKKCTHQFDGKFKIYVEDGFLENNSFFKNPTKWAVQHLQSNEVEFSNLARLIIDDEIEL